MRKVFGALGAAAGCVALAVACSSSSSSRTNEEPCNAGEVIACRSESGCDGERMCRANGLGYEPCMCSDGSVGASGAPGSGGSGGSGGHGGSMSGSGGGAGEGGEGGETIASGGAGGEAGAGQAGADPGDAGSDAPIDAGCEPMLAGCPCIDGRCGANLGCAPDDTCIAMPKPLAHWPLNNDADEISANDFNGLAINGVTFDGTAAAFDGNDSFIDISACASIFKDISNLMTVYLRVRAINWTTNPLLFGLGDVGETQATNGFWFVATNSAAAINTEAGAGVDTVTTLSTSLPTNAWLDLVFVIDQDMVDYFQDGQLVASEQFVRAETNAIHMQLGGWMEPGEALLGEIDDVQLFDVKLTAEQIEALPSTR